MYVTCNISKFSETIESFQAIQSGKLERGSIQQVFACCQETTDILGCVLDKMNGSLCRLGEYNESSPACDITGCTPFAQVRKIKQINYVLIRMYYST